MAQPVLFLRLCNPELERAVLSLTGVSQYSIRTSQGRK